MLDILIASAQARAILYGDGGKQDNNVENVRLPSQSAPVEQSVATALILLQQALGQSSQIEPTSNPCENVLNDHNAKGEITPKV